MSCVLCVIHSTQGVGQFTVYTAEDRPLRILVGSVFDMSPEITGQFDVIWDCFALVAINTEDLQRYATTLSSCMKQSGKMLMATVEYDRAEHSRHPLCITTPTITELFGDAFDVTFIEAIDITGTHLTARFKLTWAKRPVHLLVKK